MPRLPLAALAAAGLFASGCAEQLVFTTGPVSLTTDQLLPELRVTLADSGGKPLQGANRLVTVRLGENPGGAELVGQTSVGVVKGVASFTSLRVTKAGVGYTLVAEATGASAGTSDYFNVLVGTGQRLTFSGQPAGGAVNTPFGVGVTIVDPDDNAPADSTAPVTLTLNDPTGVAFVSGTLTVAADGGISLFDDLTVDRAGTGFTLTAWSPGLETATSQPFAIAEGPAGFPELVSVAQNGTDLADRRTYQVCISSDGRHVGFTSLARNLDAIVETSDDNDVFLRDREAATTERVTVAATGGEATGATPGDSRCQLSGDGRYITFLSDSDQLVAADPNPARLDAFVRDVTSDSTTLVSQADVALPLAFQYDVQAPAISSDGALVAFTAGYPGFFSPPDSNNRRDAIYRTWQGGLGAATRASRSASGTSANADAYAPALASDAVAFSSGSNNLVPSDTNNQSDIFVHVRSTNAIERVSLTSTGGELSGGDANAPAISADGSVVAFDSSSPNVVPGDQNSGRDIFARLRATNATVCVSCAADGTVGNRESFGVSLSADGRFAAFVSDATNLVKGDFNGNRDGFVKDLTTGVVVRVNVQRNGAQTVGHHTRMVAISGDGRLVAVITTAPLTAQTNYEDQVFVVRNPLAP